MNIMNMLRDMVQYISEGMSNLFSPNKDKYPAVGVQPFEGEPKDKTVEKD